MNHCSNIENFIPEVKSSNKQESGRKVHKIPSSRKGERSKMEEMQKVQRLVEDIMRGKYVDDASFVAQARDFLETASSR